MPQDALSQILDALRLRGSVYFHTHFSPPFGVRVPAYGQVARFHMAMRGSCWLTIDGVAEPLPLTTGDLVVIPRGTAHVLSDAPGREAATVDEVVARTGFNGSGALVFGGREAGGVCQLFCGHFAFDEAGSHPLLESLPRYIHLPSSRTMNAAWLDAIIRFVGAEVWGGRAGADAVVHRLSEIVFIQVIRAFVDHVGEGAGFLAAVLDPKLSRSLARFHAEPARAWTVEAMAKEAGVSRTVFAERFTSLVGMTPLGYAAYWRMHLARREVVAGKLPLIEIAERVGYGSEAALIRAFKRQFGVTPGELRRDVRAAAS